MQFVTLPYLILGFPLQEQFWALVWACTIGPGVILASLTLLMFQLLMVLRVNVTLILVIISQFPSWKPPLSCNPPWLVVGGWLEFRKCCLFHFCHVTQSWFQLFSLIETGGCPHKCCMSWVWLRNKALCWMTLVCLNGRRFEMGKIVAYTVVALLPWG